MSASSATPTTYPKIHSPRAKASHDEGALLAAVQSPHDPIPNPMTQNVSFAPADDDAMPNDSASAAQRKRSARPGRFICVLGAELREQAEAKHARVGH
jgi:hypothetical protein